MEKHDKGHAWEQASQVQTYVEHAVTRDRQRLPQMQLLTRLLPFKVTDAFRFLDLGAGPGNLSRVLLERYPRSTAVLLDASTPMLDAAATSLAEFEGRVSFVKGDFTTGLSANGGGPFGAIVSSLAVHHLHAPADEARLYADAFAALSPGGCFLNLDLVAASSPELQAVYNEADQSWVKPFFASPRHDMQPLASHLAALREAGFGPVDCFWKSLHEALYGGFRPLAP